MFDVFRFLPEKNRDVEYVGKIWAIVKETFNLGSNELTRDYMQHMGAVAILAVNEKDEVLTIHQYRHPVSSNLLEIPAGLLDFPDEAAIDAAKRELLEETGYEAKEWFTLADFCTSPGSSSEAVRIFLAKELQFVGFDKSRLQGEEIELEPQWLPLDSLIKAISTGQLNSPTASLAISSYCTLREENLRPANADWPMRENLLKTKRIFLQ